MSISLSVIPRKYITDLLNISDIQIDGSRPWDIQLKDERFFRRVFLNGSLGLGESYMDGWWECEDLDGMFFRLLRHRVDSKARPGVRGIAHCIISALMNRQSRSRAYEVGEKHYDAENDLFEHMLDSNMIYSCAYWENAHDLDTAQQAKLDLICRKLQLKPGMKILDIGCGWGGLAAYAAHYYGVSVVGVTVSREQAKLANEKAGDLPVDIRLQDYRELEERFDGVVSVGMFEHVGYKNYRKFMEVVRTCLKEGGLFLLHTIASNKTKRNCDPWFNKYIFPNGMLPSVTQIGDAIEDLFVMEDWQNMGVHYDRTLMAWHANFDQNWQKIKDRYGERFRRMWRYYLLSAAAGFRSRSLQVWQIVLSPKGVLNGYQPVGRFPEKRDFLENIPSPSEKTGTFH